MYAPRYDHPMVAANFALAVATEIAKFSGRVEYFLSGRTHVLVTPPVLIKGSLLSEPSQDYLAHWHEHRTGD